MVVVRWRLDIDRGGLEEGLTGDDAVDIRAVQRILHDQYLYARERPKDVAVVSRMRAERPYRKDL